jgi:hypothetical protein
MSNDIQQFTSPSALACQSSTRGLSTKVNRLDSQQPQNSDLLNWCQIFILHFELRLMRVFYDKPTIEQLDAINA